MKNLFLPLLVVASTITGCSKESPKTISDNNAIEFVSTIGRPTTRVAIDRFTAEEDEIGIYKLPAGDADFDNAHRANARYVFEGNNTFSPAYIDAMRWKEKAVDFVAYYPYEEGIESDHIYDIDITRQVDLLYSKTSNQTKTSNDGTVVFTFRHSLAKLNFIVTDTDETASLDHISATIDGMNTTAKFNLEDQILTDAGNIAEIRATLDNTAANVARLNAIVLPTGGATTDLNILFTLDNGDSATLSLTDKVYEANKEYTYNVTLKPGEPEEELTAVLVDSSIEGWGDGGSETPDPIDKIPDTEDPVWRVVFDEGFDSNTGPMGVIIPTTGSFSEYFVDALDTDNVFIVNSGIRLGTNLRRAQIASKPLGVAGDIRVTMTGQGHDGSIASVTANLTIEGVDKTTMFDINTAHMSKWQPSVAAPVVFENVSADATLKIATIESARRFYLDRILVEVLQ